MMDNELRRFLVFGTAQHSAELLSTAVAIYFDTGSDIRPGKPLIHTTSSSRRQCVASRPPGGRGVPASPLRSPFRSSTGSALRTSDGSARQGAFWLFQALLGRDGPVSTSEVGAPAGWCARSGVRQPVATVRKPSERLGRALAELGATQRFRRRPAPVRLSSRDDRWGGSLPALASRASGARSPSEYCLLRRRGWASRSGRARRRRPS